MKQILALLLSMIMIFALVGCSPKDTNNEQNKDEWADKALLILEEYKDETEVKDFLNAYELLTRLPNDENGFITQLKEANEIFSKYQVKLETGSYFLGEKGTFAIDEESISEYKTKAAYYDAYNLMEKLIYPILFEHHGKEAQKIANINADSVIKAIEGTNLYFFNEENTNFETTSKEYQFNGDAKATYEVTYHSDGSVKNIIVPIAISGNPYLDSDFSTFLEYDLEKQKDVAGDRFIEMQSSFTSFACGYEVLSLIFNADELNVIANYIHSLSKYNIWEKNIAETELSTSHLNAVVCFDYKGNDISINYGLNSIKLSISGGNYINTLSSKWHTVWLGLCHKAYGEDILNTYKDYLECNTEKNNEVSEFSFDLDTNEEKFEEAVTQNQENAPDQNGDVQTSIPVELSLNEKIEVSGVIEKNDGAFPDYRLRINPTLSIIFTDDESDVIYTCDYLYFYNEPELNGNYPFKDFVGNTCNVTATLEDYRGGGDLFFLNPVITMN